MRIDSLFIGVLIFSLFAIVGANLHEAIGTNYDQNLSTTFYNDSSQETGKFAKIDEIFNKTEYEAKQKIIGSDSELAADQDPTEALIKGAYETIKTTPAVFGVVNDIIQQLALDMGIQPVIVGFLLVAFLFLFVFSLIFLILRFRQ